MRAVNRYRYAISLRIWHPSIDPTEITAALRLNPARVWRAGDLRSTPKGGALEGLYRESYWASGDLVRGEWPGKSLSAALNELLDRLVEHRNFFRAVRDANGRSEFFVGWYFEGNSGDVIDCRTLGRMADLCLDLSLDYYPPDQPQTGIQSRRH